MQIGKRHPDPIVETSSLASVEPPEVWYELAMPDTIYRNGALSALQLEAIVYSCQKVNLNLIRYFLIPEKPYTDHIYSVTIVFLFIILFKFQKVSSISNFKLKDYMKRHTINPRKMRHGA